MSTINDGGPAFPVEWTNDSDVNLTAPNGRVTPPGGTEQLPGMSLRDHFAAKAMQSLLTTIDEFPDEHWRTGVAMDAYAMADAMLKVRKERT